MVDVFEEQICSICKKHDILNCKKAIFVKEEKNMKTIYCNDYDKDETKIVPYVQPLFVTAERDYINKVEI